MVDFNVDFSPLGKLGEIYQQAQQRQAIAQQYPGSGGDLNLARLALAAQQDQRDFALRREEIARAQSNTDRSFGYQQQEAARAQGNVDRSFGFQEKQFTAAQEGNKVPAGFRPTPGGGLAPVPGGPTDPAYIHSTTEAKDKGKEFNAGEITKLVDEGGKLSNLAGFTATFQDRFAGYKVPGVGSAVMSAGRHIPGAVGMVPGLNEADVKEGASWWQNYDRYKNVVRNELFGASLTPGETRAFEQADITPAMDPAQIKKNLETQQSLIKEAMKKKAGALIAGGYKPEPIARAYGLKLEDLGVDTTKKGAPAAPAAPATSAAPAKIADKAAYDALPSGTPYVAPDGSVRTKK